MADKIGLIACGIEQTNMPLDSISIQTNIYGLLAHFEAAFSYTNSSKDPIEVEFKHPLHSDSVLVGIEAVIDGKRMKGIVKEKEEAKAVYEDAVASGNTAVLVKEETQDVVGIVLGNLSPGKKAEVRLQLLQQLQVEEQGIHLLLPATLKPRYEMSTEASSRQMLPPVINSNILPAVYKFNFELFIVNDIGKLKQIISPSHPLEEFVATDGRKGMHLTSLDPLNTDLVAYIDYEAIHPLSAMIEPALPVREEKPAQHPFIDNPAVLLTFLPKSSHAEAGIRGEYIFVIDQSGSMSGDAIRNARETLEMLVRSLSPGSFFNIIGFGSSFHPLFPKGSIAYDQSSLERGVQHAKGLEASLGGTEILSPLKHIYSKKPVPELSRQIFLLTDGGVSDTAAVVKAVSDNAGNTRVFTFGIGSGVSTDLVTNVARAGKGKAMFISGKERMQSRVMEVMNIAMSPSYTDIRVTGSKEMTVYPKSIPVLFENEPFVVVAFLSEKMVKGEKMSATLEYSSDREAKVCTVEFSLSDSVLALSPQLPSELVHQFGVSKALRELEGGASSKEECVTLSCYTNVLCKQTAFVAVSEDEGRVVEGSMKVYSLKMAPADTSYYDNTLTIGSSAHFHSARKSRQKKKKLSKSEGSAPMSGYFDPSSLQSASLVEACYSEEKESDTLCFDSEFTSESMDLNLPSTESGLESFAGFTYNIQSESELGANSYKSSPVGHQSIMALQKAEGHWDYSEEIEKLLSCKEVKKSCPNELKDLKIWVTMLCIACLQTRFAGYKSEWLLVSKKGERWIESKLESVGGKPSYQHLLKLATDCLQA